MESECLMDVGKLSIAFFLSPGGQKDFYPSIQTSECCWRLYASKDFCCISSNKYPHKCWI